MQISDVNQTVQVYTSRPSNTSKDDYSLQGTIVYYILFMCFIGLAALGVHNAVRAYRMGKFKCKSILIFYVSSLTVIFLRIMLFTDQFIDYTWNFYVIVLITMPTFIYLITGLSQVMCSFELILKFKNLEINESLGTT